MMATQLPSIDHPSIACIAIQRIGRLRGFLEKRPRGRLSFFSSVTMARAQSAQATQFHPDQPVLHGDRRATFLRVSKGVAIIRYHGDSHAHSVPLESLSLPAVKRR